MDCEQCDKRLMDLLYDELGEEEAKSAHAHLASCDACRKALDELAAVRRVASHLPREEPREGTDGRVLRVARQQAEARRRGVSIPPPDDAGGDPAVAEDGPRRMGGVLLEWLRWLTPGPQASMALVMLIVVAIGLWYLPYWQRSGVDAAGQTVVGDESPDPAAPAKAAHPPSGRGLGLGDARPKVADEDGEAGAAGARGTRADYRAAVSEYRHGSYLDAIEQLQRIVRNPAPDAQVLVPHALHYMARSQIRQGTCATAIDTYEKLLSSHEDYRRRPEAMMEAAHCYNILGRTEDARRWLGRAAQHDRTRESAHRRLRALDAQQN